ncbi:hypothetical protein COU38_00295, partial [Candidatus Micrarchaeota archaeon CG10_big_fil_rev_8_21_14_0_10_54_18]
MVFMRQGLFLLLLLAALFSVLALQSAFERVAVETPQQESFLEPAPMQEAYPEHAPRLLKSLPDVLMESKSVAEIDLTEYFENPCEGALDFVAAYDSENLAIYLEDGVVRVAPHAGFLGNTPVVFYAGNDYRQTAGNPISLRVVEELDDIDIDGAASFTARETPEFAVQFRNGLAGGNDGVSLSSTSSASLQKVSWKKSGQTASFATGFAEPSWSRASFTATVAEEDAREFQPGTQLFRVQVEKDGVLYVKQKEFSWGVLALNPDKNFYAPNEQAFIGIAVLDDAGHMVCNAAVELLVTDPSGRSTVLSTANGLITISPECSVLGATTTPDYYAFYATGAAGVYELRLTAETRAGTQTINDSFAVQETAFDVRRSGPTRIYPSGSHEMSIEVKAGKGFQGKIIERVPLSFNITPQPGLRVTVQENAKELEWVVFLEAGDSITLNYEFAAPPISPHLFFVGPLSIGLWSESRTWAIASDATANLIMFWDGTEGSIPDGWTCISCTPLSGLNDRYIRADAAYSEAAGGASTHTHTVGGYNSGTQSATNNANPGLGVASNTHTHTITASIGYADNLPLYRSLIVIKYDAGTGIPLTLPLGVIGLFNNTVPDNWVQYSEQNNYYIRGSDVPNSTGGSNTHSHSAGGTLTTTVTGEVAKGTGTANALAQTAHSHTINAGTTDTPNSEPPYKTIILGKLTVDNDALPNGLIGMFNATPGSSWTVISGLPGGAMNSKFLKASDSYGSTGGNTKHSHADVTGLTSTGETESANNNAGLGPSSGAAKAHSHTGISLSSFSNADNAPLYSNVILAYYAKANLKIAQHRIYQDNSMVLGAGTLRCNLTSAYGENVGDGECDNVSNGNLAVNTLHRAEFWLCNDVNLGEAATFDYFNHNLTTNKEYQIGEFYDACYHGDGAI